MSKYLCGPKESKDKIAEATARIAPVRLAGFMIIELAAIARETPRNGAIAKNGIADGGWGELFANNATNITACRIIKLVRADNMVLFFANIIPFLAVI